MPLLDTERIFKSSTSATVCDPVTGHGPVNRFCSIRNLASAGERTVNGPNNDTLYSVAWLDLSKQPMVLHAPPIKHRFWEFELVDPWTNDFFNITSAHLKMGAGHFNVTGGGNWAVVGPALQGQAAPWRDPRELAIRPRMGDRPHLPPQPAGSRQRAPDPGRILDHAAVEVRHRLQAATAHEDHQ